MKEIGIDLTFNDNKVIAGWQEQIELTRRLIGNVEKLEKTMSNTADRSSGSLGGIQKSTESVNRNFGGMSKAIKASVIIAALKMVGDVVYKLGSYAVKTAASMESLQASFALAYGNTDLAAQKLSLYQDIASKTPFQFEELAKAMLKLKNRGFDPTREEIIKLGDLAASQGKEFDQLVEALLDAQTGEFERLKEFGIVASKNGNQAKLTFRGVTEEVNFNAESIGNLIMSYGGLQGIQGSMEKQAETFNGLLSTLRDNVDGLAREAGAELLPAIKPIVDNLISLLDNLDFQEIKAYFAPIVDTVLPAVKELVFQLFKFITKITTGGTDEKAYFGGIQKQANALLDAVVFVTRAVTGFLKLLNTAADFPVIKQLLSLLRGTVGLIDTALQGLAKITGGNAEAAQNAAIEALNNKKAKEKAIAAAVKYKVSEDVAYQIVASQEADEDIAAAKAAEKTFKNYLAKRAASFYGVKGVEFDAEVAKARAAKINADKAAADAQAKATLSTLQNETKNKKSKVDSARKELERLEEQILLKDSQAQIDNEKDAIKKAELIYAAEKTKIDALKKRLIELAASARIQIDINKLLESSYAQAKRKRDEDIAAELFERKKKEIDARKEEKTSLDNIRSAELAKLQASNQIKNELAAREDQAEAARLEQSFVNTKITSEEIEIKKLELAKKQHERRMAEYIRQRKQEAAIKGEKYDPNLDIDYQKQITEGEGIQQDIDGANANKNTKTELSKTAGGITTLLKESLGLSEDEAKAIQDSFNQVFSSIIEGWRSVTAAQIESNNALQESLRQRSESAQQRLNSEIEIAKLGYANNVSSKQKELDDINAAQKKAFAEGLQLKKQQAKQELIISEIQAGASLAEAIAKTFTAYSSIPFAGIALAAVQIGVMVASFLRYKAQMKGLSAQALYKGGRPVDFLLSGESPHRDAPGHGRGHAIEGTNLKMGAYEMIINEASTTANLPFFKAVNAGKYDKINLLEAFESRKLLPSLLGTVSDIQIISENGSAEKMAHTITAAVDRAMGAHLTGLKSYFDSKPERVSHNGMIIEYTRSQTKIIKLYEQ